MVSHEICDLGCFCAYLAWPCTRWQKKPPFLRTKRTNHKRNKSWPQRIYFSEVNYVRCRACRASSTPQPVAVHVFVSSIATRGRRQTGSLEQGEAAARACQPWCWFLGVVPQQHQVQFVPRCSEQHFMSQKRGGRSRGETRTRSLG
jgi:hypothetical protein